MNKNKFEIEGWIKGNNNIRLLSGVASRITSPTEFECMMRGPLARSHFLGKRGYFLASVLGKIFRVIANALTNRGYPFPEMGGGGQVIGN